MAWFIQVFGSPKLRHRGQFQSFGTKQLDWLLLVLACSNGVSRETLRHLFWLDSNEARAKANLRMALSQLKSGQFGSALRFDGQMVYLDIPSDWQAFWTALGSGDDLTAMDLAREVLLSEISCKQNALLEWREQQRQLVFEAWKAAIWRSLPQLEVSMALFWLERLLSRDPYSEQDLQMALAWCKEHGFDADGRRWYKRFEGLLLQELGALPSQTTQTLFWQLESAHQPRQTAFFGRSKELERLRLLAEKPDVRLVSIIGLGGSGKTRLALEALQSQNPLVIGLQHVVSIEAFQAVVAQALGLQGAWLEERLVAALEARGGLVLLDSAEHLNLEARELLQNWVDSVSAVQWWLTSREPMLETGEVLSLKGLDFSSGGFAQSEAAQLFLAVTKRVRPDFVADNLELIDQLCTAVQGLPLGLEMLGAAAQQYDLAGLQRVFLKGSKPSLTKILETSWNGLSPIEKHILITLVVLPNQISVLFFMRLCPNSADTLEGLQQRGWLQIEQEQLTLHELIRQFLEPYRTKETQWQFIHEHQRWLESMQQSKNWQQLGLAWHQLKAAWQTANQLAAWQQLEQMVWLYWQAIENLELYQDALGFLKTDTEMPSTLQSAILTLIAWCETKLGRGHDALQKIAQALELHNHRYTLEAQAMALFSTGDYTESQLIWEQTLEAHLFAGDQIGEARALLYIGDLAFEKGNSERAETLFLDTLRLARLHQDSALCAKALHLLGVVAVRRGQLELGRNRYQEAIEHLGQSQALSRAKLHNNIAVIDHMTQNIELARTGYQQSLELRRPHGDVKGVAQLTANLAMLEWDYGNRLESMRIHEQALSMRQRLKDTRGIINSQNCLCEVYLHFQMHQPAKDCAFQATQMALELGAEVLYYHCLLSFAALSLRENQLEAAARYLAHPWLGQSSQECKFSAEPYFKELEAKLSSVALERYFHLALAAAPILLLNECLGVAKNEMRY